MLCVNFDKYNQIYLEHDSKHEYNTEMSHSHNIATVLLMWTEEFKLRNQRLTI